MHSRQDSYVEQGGGLPAAFDSQAEGTTELRLGVQGAHPLGNSGFDLIGLLEGNHRFDERGQGTSGQVQGLFAFDLPGAAYGQNWLRVGLGVEGQLGVGKASLMVNATTEGEMPSAWLAGSYQLAF